MSIMDDTSEHLSHMGGNHKQLSFKQVVEVGADCEYILRAAECFEEEKAYVRSGNFSAAITKVFLAVQHLITKSPDVDTPVKVHDKEVVNYVLQKCDEYGEEVSGYCKEDSAVCSLKDFNAKKLHQKLKAVVEESEADLHILGVECALLCHIVTILHTCKIALHFEDRAAALAEASYRLKKLLYDDQSMKTSCSLGSLTKFFESADSADSADMDDKQPLLRGCSDRTEVPSWCEKDGSQEIRQMSSSLEMFNQSNDDNTEGEEEIGFFCLCE